MKGGPWNPVPPPNPPLVLFHGISLIPLFTLPFRLLVLYDWVKDRNKKGATYERNGASVNLMRTSPACTKKYSWLSLMQVNFLSSEMSERCLSEARLDKTWKPRFFCTKDGLSQKRLDSAFFNQSYLGHLIVRKCALVWREANFFSWCVIRQYISY